MHADFVKIGYANLEKPVAQWLDSWDYVPRETVKTEFSLLMDLFQSQTGTPISNVSTMRAAAIRYDLMLLSMCGAISRGELKNGFTE